MIACTGIGQLGPRWAQLVETQVLCRDIEVLDLHAPGALRELWLELEGEFGPIPSTSTVYHFGRSEETADYTAFAYRSADNFVSERIQSPGFGVKPPPTGRFDLPETIEAMIALAERIRDEQDASEDRDRLYIGSELILVALQNGAISSTKVHRWADFESQWSAMNARLADCEA